MSKTESREYVLNVAQQFLQETSRNPLKDKSWFDAICGKNGEDANCFYRNFANEAKDFLKGFQGNKLQQILCAGLAPVKVRLPGASDSPKKTGMWSLHPETGYLLDGDGEQVLRNLACVSLVAAAYDLCYAKHHQNGIRPL